MLNPLNVFLMPKLTHLNPVSTTIHFVACGLFLSFFVIIYGLLTFVYYAGFEFFKLISFQMILEGLKALIGSLVRGVIFGSILGFSFAHFYNVLAQNTGGLEYGTDQKNSPSDSGLLDK